MKAKKYLSKIMILAMVILGVQSSVLYSAEWVNISGSVYYNGQPLSVMVLANGQYMFTDGADGRYNLNVPLDNNGQITLFSFCDGLAPFRKTLNSWEAVNYNINMSAASAGSQSMSITTAQSPSAKDGWVKISGAVRSGDGTALCAMVLANGQQMFSCDGNGSYNLEVPLDSNRNITLFGFCDGMMPYKQIINIPSGDANEYSLGDSGKPDDYEDSVLDFAMFDDFDSYLDMLPQKFDWRDRGAVAPAKDQKSCGSCWAFTAVGVMESKIRINGGSLLDLSEQQQISCNTEMLGCFGGKMDSLKFWYSRGPMDESCAEYVQSDIPCININHCEKLSFTTDGYYTVETDDIDEVKISLYKDGPGYFRYDVYPDFMEFWKTYSPGNVYKNSGGNKSGGHAVMIMGWDDAKNAWLCKNSWGTTAGPNGDGSFWIAWSGHANDLDFAMANVKLAMPDDNISVTSPNGKEDWCIGNDYTIQWKTGTSVDHVKIELYKDGSRERTIAERVSGSGSYVWTIPNLTESSSYKIRISDYSDSSVYDESDAYFSIVKDCKLSVQSPNGGEKWYIGDTHAIEWNPGVSDDDVKIYLFKEKEQIMMRITAETDNNGSYIWIVPDTLAEGSDYRIYVKSYFDESIADESDAYFSIVRYDADVPPVANAGEDKTLNEGTLVTLNGYASDSDGYIVSYFWEQVGGMSMGDFAGSSATLTFTAPAVGSAGTTLTFKLTVTDNDGLSHSDTCTVQIKDSGSASSYTNSLGMTFNLIPAGTFMMGSPENEPGRYGDETRASGYADEGFLYADN